MAEIQGAMQAGSARIPRDKWPAFALTIPIGNVIVRAWNVGVLGKEKGNMKWLNVMMALLVALVAVGTSQAAPDVAVLPAEVRGVVLFPDGETPVDRLPVRVWNADTEEVVFKTRTNGDGVFDVPRLEEGNHYVTVGPVRIDMRILTARAGVTPQPHGFVVVIPKRMPAIQTLVPSSITAAAAALSVDEPPEIVSP